LYGDALKRLDDAQDSVRQSVCRLFSIMLRADGLNGMTQLDRIHHEHICQQLFIHLDDSNPAVREAVCQALMSGKGGVLGEELVSAQAQSVSANFRHQDILKRFL
jgi:hypothetical protein